MSGSPVVTDKLLFVFNEEGLCQVVDIANKGEAKVINELDLKDEFFAHQQPMKVHFCPFGQKFVETQQL